MKKYRFNCILCDNRTPVFNFGLCSRCHELEQYIKANPDLAKKILAFLDQQVVVDDREDYSEDYEFDPTTSMV